jgi:hypothetical protein
MSRVFAENENNDIYLGSDNRLAINNDLDAVLQSAQAAVEIQKGEALYNQNNGMPNDSVIWSGTPNLQQFEFFARKQISNVAGVIDIENFIVTTINDVLQYQATIKTIYGTGGVDGSI